MDTLVNLSNPESHIILNGEIISASQPIAFHNNRAFCYGDGLFETMHASGTDIQFAEAHFSRLYKGMAALKMKISDSVAKEKVCREVKRLLNRDKLFKSARVRLTVFRDSTGYFLPKANEISYLVECAPLENEYYQLNQKGLSIDIFNEFPKTISPLSPFKTCNSLLNILAGIYAKERGLDDCLLINNKGVIIESSNSNIFLVKKDIVYTPALAQGCVDGIMRSQIMDLAIDSAIRTEEIVMANENVLLDADEIFLTNAISGVRWVMAFRQRRYFNKVAKLFSEKLNAEAFKV